MDQRERCLAFRALHEDGFVLPNPWDRGSAIALASMGFKALATTSAGLAFSLGRVDSPKSLDLDLVLSNIREIVDASDLPVNADFQSGYGERSDDVASSVRLCVETGVAGLSIEDATGDDLRPLFGVQQAVERIQAAREAINNSQPEVLLTARAEAFLVEHPQPLVEVIERLIAFAEAGADCLYAPGLRTPEQVETVVTAVAPKPVNVLVTDTSWMTVDSLINLGARRISVGSGLARVAWGAFLRAGKIMAEQGSFDSLENAAAFSAMNSLFSSVS